MPNYNGRTGIAFGVVSLNSLADWVYDEFFDHGKNLTAEACLAEFMAENPGADDDAIQSFWDHYEGSEENYELTTDGMKLGLSYLGGGALVWVYESPVTAECAPCSPCVPGAGDLDTKRAGGMVAYDLPADWYATADAK